MGGFSATEIIEFFSNQTKSFCCSIQQKRFIENREHLSKILRNIIHSKIICEKIEFICPTSTTHLCELEGGHILKSLRHIPILFTSGVENEFTVLFCAKCKSIITQFK